jgi:tetratricopeptide (TPR) repeat protein
VETTSTRKPLSFAWLFLGSLLFYGLYLVQAQQNPILGAPLIDAFIYDQWAERMARGHWLWDRVGNYMPVYPAFLALLKIVSAGMLELHTLVQGVMGAGASVLVARITLLLWSDRAAAWAAGVLHATAWMFVLHYAELYAESFSIFFLYVTLYLLVARRGAGAAAFFAGVAMALSGGARANLFLLIPWIGLWLLFPRGAAEPGAARIPRPTFKGLRQAALFGLGVALVLTPILARNYELTGQVMLRAQGTWSLYSGLAPEIGGLNPQIGVQFDNYMRMPLREGHRSEADIEAFWARKVDTLLKEQPGAVFRLLLKKVVIFLADREYSKEFDVYAHRSYAWILALPWPGMGLLASLGFAGCLFCRKRSDVVLVLGLLALSIISIFPFKVFGRYRMPTEALLIPFAGWWLAEAFRAWRARNLRRCGLLAVPALAIGLVAYPDWLRLGDAVGARHEHLVGQYMAMTGRPEAAEMAYRASMEAHAWDADSPYRLARLAFADGRTNEAVQLYREALKREPRYPEAQAGLAEIYFHQGNLPAADAAVTLCLEQYPNYVPAWQIKAWIANKAGRTDEEIRCYRRAIDEGAGGVVYFQLARRYEELDRRAEARALYELLATSPGVPEEDRARAAAALRERGP